MDEVKSIIQEVQSNPAIEAAVLISGKPGCFIAGADINMIERCKTKEEVVALSKNGVFENNCIIKIQAFRREIFQ